VVLRGRVRLSGRPVRLTVACRTLAVRVKRAGVPRVLVSHAVWPAIFQRTLQVNDCPAKLIRMRYRAVLYCCEPRSRLDDNAGTGWHW
jgi:hypothetical protein